MPCPTLSELPPPPSSKIGCPCTEESPPLPEKMPNGSPWPGITVVTPSYNQSEFIEETIRSVLLQSYPDLEYTVMDGGSTDGSVDIIRRYEPWLSYLHIGPDGGQAAVIAEGFGQAAGEILAWLNSDDRNRPAALGHVGSFSTTHPRVVFGSGDVNYIEADGGFLQRLWAIRPTRFLTANLGVHCWPQQGCFWRHSAYEEVGRIDSSLRFCLNRDLFIRLAGSTPSRRIPGPPLADFRIHDPAKSSTILDTARQEGEALQAKYGSPYVRQWKQLLRFLWWFWRQPNRLRGKLHRYFGWEV